MLKYVVIAGAVAAIGAYAWSSRSDPNVYDLPQAEVYRLLTTTKVEQSGKGPLGNREISISGNGESTVRWLAGGTFATTRCQADLSPEGSETRITAYCDGGSISSGAANGMLQGMMRKRLIEHIDATLTGRPFDPQKAMGATASLWPADVRQPDGTIGTAVNEAVKMDRDLRQSMDEIEKEAKKAGAAQQMEVRSQMPSSATRPMVDLTH